MMGAVYCASRTRVQRGTTTPPAETRPGLLFEADFETLASPYSLGFQAEGNATATSVAIAGRNAARIELRHFVDSDPMRTEIQPNPLPTTYFTEGLFAQYGPVYWFGMKTYTPADRENDTSGEVIIQWHDWPDAGENWKNAAICIMIEVVSGVARYRLKVKADSKAITPPAGTAGRYTVDDSYDLGTVAATAGTWVDWVFRMKWGYDSTGETTLWMNGTQVVNVIGKGNAFNDAKGPYFKCGMYKWDWETATDTGADVRLIYFDDIRIAAGPDAVYASVAPTP